MILDLVCLTLIGVGVFFFAAGTLGLLRFPDVYSRLHALTKADNLGLALVLLGVGGLTGSPVMALKLALVWVFVALASATCGHLIASYARRTPQPESRR
jgi:multicomponent Na+:H+ antiporter subunit G